MTREQPQSGERPHRHRNQPRYWRDKFREAFRGVKRGVRGHSSFAVHFFFAILAFMLAIVLECELWEWCVVIGCIGLVLTAELFNSSVETLFRGLDAEARDRVYGCLDIAAGAVLIAALTAAAIGVLIFGRKILLMLHLLSA